MEAGQPGDSISISSVKVEGLHGQFFVELRLNPRLNIIYGKNGRGKTTLLHILANVLELDFNRFRFLQFRRITLTTSQSRTLEIVRGQATPDDPIEVLVDRSRTSPVTVESGLSEAELAEVRSVLGERAVYLPAFRAILERSRIDTYSNSYAARDSASATMFDSIARAERQIQKRGDPKPLRRAYLDDRARDQASATAMKTIQCREWFGQFVPTIRYPSLAEVENRLTGEVREATYEMAREDEEMLSSVFTSVIKEVLNQQPELSFNEESAHAPLEELRRALESLSSSAAGLYTEIHRALSKIEPHTRDVTTNRVLRLYAKLLEHRIDVQEKLFSRIREFETSVNRFLDRKYLKIDSRGSRHTRSPSIVAEGKDRLYGLSTLSSGERQVLTMLFCATRMADFGGPFLIDEPELSLHVDWQRIILGEIMRQAGDRQIIACTHSPEVGADHLEAIQFFEPPLSETSEELIDDDLSTADD